MSITTLEDTIILSYARAEKYHFIENAYNVQLQPDGIVYVLYDERRCMPISEALVAFSYHLFPDAKITSMEKNKDAIYVHSSNQRKGIGTEIVSIMEDISRKLGITRVEIEDARAIDFWKKLGYSFVDYGYAIREL